MKSEIVVTTTNSIEGSCIEKYIDLIATNVVVGTNFFSDFGASITDIFGGMSDTYQSKLHKIYKIGIDKLKTKADQIGANAIVGVKIDFDEVSGKGKSMFMVSIIGTAVRMRCIDEKTREAFVYNTITDKDTLEKELTKRTIISKLKVNSLPIQNEWLYLLNAPFAEISDCLLEIYLTTILKHVSQRTEQENLLITNVPTYFKNLAEESAITVLYSKLTQAPKVILDLIVANDLFSAKDVLDLLQSKKTDIAVACLKANRNYYSKTDLQLMKEMLILLNNLKDMGKTEAVKNVLGKAKEKYICPNGHVNNIEDLFCTTYDCGKNIKGLSENQVKQIELFKAKVDALNSIL